MFVGIDIKNVLPVGSRSWWEMKADGKLQNGQ